MILTQKATRKYFRDVAVAALDIEASLDEGNGGQVQQSLARLNAALVSLSYTSFVPALPAIRRAE